MRDSQITNLDKTAVCMVVYNKYPSDPRVRRAAEALTGAGYKVHVVCTSEEGVPPEDEYNGVSIHRVPVLKDSGVKFANFIAVAVFMVRSAIKVLSINRRFHPAFYHVHSLPDFLVLVVLIPRMLGAKVVLDLHESFPEIVKARFNKGASVLARIAGWLERLSCMVSDRVIVVNDTIAGLVQKRGESPEKITVIMNSPKIYNSSDSISRIHPEIETAKKAGELFFVYAGGLNRERDLITLLKAVDILRKKGISLRVLIFSHTKTPYLSIFEEHISSLGLNDLALFCGSLPSENVLANISLGSLGIVTYERNPITEVALPNKVFEYIEAGLPLVVAALPTLRELLGDAVSYYIPGDPLSLSEGIKTALYGQDKMLKIKKAISVYEKCSWSIMSSRLLALYDSLKKEMSSESDIRKGASL